MSMDVQCFCLKCLNMDFRVSSFSYFHFSPDFWFVLLFLHISLVFCGGLFSGSSLKRFFQVFRLTCRVSDQLDRRADSADRYPLKHRPWGMVGGTHTLKMIHHGGSHTHIDAP